MECPEYMRIHFKYFMEDMRNKYDIDNIIAPDGYVYWRIKCGMYSLKQAARIAYDALLINLKNNCYAPDKYSPNIWVHESRDTNVFLCVDDFGVKYTSKADVQYLINALQENYDITIDWSGQVFCGLDLEWNYAQGYVDNIMRSFVIKTLQKPWRAFHSKPQYAPRKWTVPAYGQNR